MAKKAARGGGRPVPQWHIDLEFSPEEGEAVLNRLQARFESNMHRHADLAWPEIRDRVGAHPDKLAALVAMERTGGEPDVIGRDAAIGAFIYCDCSPQSPHGRRSLCYDGDALASRKRNKPSGSAVEAATLLGIELLTEAQYRELQKLGEFDTKTSSWVQTPPEIRALGGALFCDRRYNHVFVYHNGAESYYAARGFRGRLLV